MLMLLCHISLDYYFIEDVNTMTEPSFGSMFSLCILEVAIYYACVYLKHTNVT